MTQFSGSQLLDGSITADKLAPGAAGANWFMGEGAPSDAIGINGDFYFDRYNGLVFGPKASGTWPAGIPSTGTAMNDRDAGGRLRVSQPKTLFDSKMRYNAQPFLWDDQEVSGSGTSSTHSPNQAAVLMSVSNLTAGKRVRQTFQSFNYQSGKAQQTQLSGQMVSEVGIVTEIGYFTEQNGVFFRVDDGVVSVVRRSFVTGVAVDTVHEQADWDDPMNGNGASGITLDITKVQLMNIDFEWFGVGPIRFALQIGGTFHVVHSLSHTNQLGTVFMSDPNLPVRYSIENKGNGPAATMQHICATVIAEGGHEPEGILGAVRTNQIANFAANTTYALIGMKLKTTHLSAAVVLEQVSALLTSPNDTAYWEVRINPSVAGTFTYNDTQCAVAIALATNNTNSVTGGRVVQGGFFQTSQAVQSAIPNALRIGRSIAGVLDALVFCITPISGSVNALGSLTWRELS